jgi:5'(3')-deoxyribonucleotidase
MTDHVDDQVALVDLDDTVAAYSKALREQMRLIQAPDEPAYMDRMFDREEPYMEARRKLIQRQPGFWRGLEPIPLGFEIVEELRKQSFGIHVLTKGPKTTPSAWSEKVEWSTQHMPYATVTVAGDKSLVYGRVLVDDWPTYFEKWLLVRPRGLVICPAHPCRQGRAEVPPERAALRRYGCGRIAQRHRSGPRPSARTGLPTPHPRRLIEKAGGSRDGSTFRCMRGAGALAGAVCPPPPPRTG